MGGVNFIVEAYCNQHIGLFCCGQQPYAVHEDPVIGPDILCEAHYRDMLNKVGQEKMDKHFRVLA